MLLSGCASGPRGAGGIGRDGPDAKPPAGLGQVPDAEPRIEAIRGNGGTSKPYVVLGRSYLPITDDRPLRETGLASWYGRKFHGQPNARGEPYDMYAMTAAHKTLPLPSYVRVRNPANGREAIVRVNDRGPFHDDRVIDLSYTAALKLDLLRGVAPVEIERITNTDIAAGTWRRGESGAGALASASPAMPRFGTVPSADSVAVPAALTTPVVAMPRAEARELAALPPLAPEAPAPSTPIPDAAPPVGGFWVQLGAFSQREGADRFRQQVARSLPALAPALNVFAERGTFRLQAGPHASRELAGDTVDQLRNGLQLSPIIVERR